MKRTRFIALALVVAVMMMGAGYAYWTQDLTIENTVDTGVLDVVFTDPTLSTSSDYMENCYFRPAATDGNYNLELNLGDAYPGADFTFGFNLDNNGTMEANVRDFTVTNTNAGRKDLVYVRSYTVGTTTTPVTGDVTLEAILDTFDTYDGGDGIIIPDNGIVPIQLACEIKPLATSTELPEGTDDAISFTINAIAHQYNE